MEGKIDSKTVVPIGWVLSGFGAVSSCVALATFWVASVNSRLSRIEEKLGIPKLVATWSVLPEAHAVLHSNAEELHGKAIDRR